MNTPEKIVGAYLRLNGFFLLSEFTIFEYGYHTHVDFLGLRPPSSGESITTEDEMVTLPLDHELFNLIRDHFGLIYQDNFIGLVAEIKGNQEVEYPSPDHVEYASRLFGKDLQVLPLAFSQYFPQIGVDSGVICVPIKHSLHWILHRFHWMNKYLPRLTKIGSWNLSEEFLSDLLYLQQVDFANNDINAKSIVEPEAEE